MGLKPRVTKLDKFPELKERPKLVAKMRAEDPDMVEANIDGRIWHIPMNSNTHLARKIKEYVADGETIDPAD
jgi:hypothetical protein